MFEMMVMEAGRHTMQPDHQTAVLDILDPKVHPYAASRIAAKLVEEEALQEAGLANACDGMRCGSLLNENDHVPGSPRRTNLNE